MCCDSWCRKESYTTERLNGTELKVKRTKENSGRKNLDIKDVFFHIYNLEAFAKPFSTTNSESDWFEVEEAFKAKVPILAPTLQLRVFCIHQMTQPSQKLSHFSCISFVTSCTVTTGFLCPWDFPGKNTGVGCHFLLQGIFLTQELKPGLLYCSQVLYQLCQ